MSRPTFLQAVVVLVALVAAPGAVLGQTTMDWDPRGTELGRDELTDLLHRLETAASSPGYSGRIREQARLEAEIVRSRLEEGDFQVGDRVVVQVQGDFSDTVAVEPRRVITLPGMGEIPLAGVLRSELEQHLTRELSAYLRDPVVEATSLVRIAVLGQVVTQGFYTMPASLLVEEALMLAGGPAPDANLDGAEIMRGNQVIWEDDALQRAITDGRTLDQLSLRAGDRIMIPRRTIGFFEGGVLRTLLVVVPPVTYLLVRVLGR
jgi:protein involved in polysaccharide export with SLBB domain